MFNLPFFYYIIFLQIGVGAVKVTDCLKEFTTKMKLEGQESAVSRGEMNSLYISSESICSTFWLYGLLG